MPRKRVRDRLFRVLGISLIARIERQRIREQEHQCQQKSTRLVFTERCTGKSQKLWFAVDRERLILVHPVIKHKGVVGVSEALFGQFFAFVLRFNPVKELRSISFVFGISGLVSLETFVVPFFSSRAAFGSSPER